MSRIEPARAPFTPAIEDALDKIMRGAPPLVLFTTLARDERLFAKFFNGGLLDRGNLTIRQREIVICRVTARCGAEYEWGIHVARYGPKAGLSAAEIRALTHSGAHDSCWASEEQLLLRMCDALHADCDIGDDLWAALAGAFTPEALIELLMLAGFYRTVSYLANGLRLPLEENAARFSDYKAA